VLWDHLDAEKIEAIPVLAALHRQFNSTEGGAGR